MKKLLATLILTSSLFAQNYDFSKLSKEKLYKNDITALEAFELKAKGIEVIDVRSKQEYDFRHVPGAFWIPIYFDSYGKRVFNRKFIEQVEYELKGKKETNLILVSKKEARAKYAANILALNGYKNISIIKGGFLGKEGWLRSGLQYWRRDR